MTLANMRRNGVRAVTAKCEACWRTLTSMSTPCRDPCCSKGQPAPTMQPMRRREDDTDEARRRLGVPDYLRMKSREEQLTWAKQRALICVDMGHFTDAVRGLRAEFADNPLTKGVISSDQALRGYKAAMDAALGRGSQALTSGSRTLGKAWREADLVELQRSRAALTGRKSACSASCGTSRRFRQAGSPGERAARGRQRAPGFVKARQSEQLGSRIHVPYRPRPARRRLGTRPTLVDAVPIAVTEIRSRDGCNCNEDQQKTAQRQDKRFRPGGKRSRSSRRRCNRYRRKTPSRTRRPR